jgi:hypothetical protein
LQKRHNSAKICVSILTPQKLILYCFPSGEVAQYEAETKTTKVDLQKVAIETEKLKADAETVKIDAKKAKVEVEQIVKPRLRPIESLWTGWHTFAMLVAIAIIIVVGLQVPESHRLYAWVATLLTLTVFAIVVGQGITGRLPGLLIDYRNKISLSRLQMVLWTMLVLSAFLTASLSNVSTGRSNPLSIEIPVELWMLLGISTTSLVGSPLITSQKKRKKPDVEEEASTMNQLAQQGIDASKVDSKGLIVTYDNINQSRWSDLFRGDESGNAAHLDLAKMQMFYFTIILVIAYGIAMGTELATQNAIDKFPELDSGMLALLTISHGGYLTSKAIPHSTTE